MTPPPSSVGEPDPAAQSEPESKTGRLDRRIAIAGLIVAFLGLPAGYLGYVKDVFGLFRHDPKPAQVVIDPKAGFGGVPVFAVPKSTEDAPVDYLRSGALTSVDCFAKIPIDKAAHNYLFLRITSNEVDAGRWIDFSQIVMPDGSDVNQGLRALPSCSSP
jgi:hypothetical protein